MKNKKLNKTKLILGSLGILGVTAVPIVTVVSCVSNNPDPDVPETPVLTLTVSSPPVVDKNVASIATNVIIGCTGETIPEYDLDVEGNSAFSFQDGANENEFQLKYDGTELTQSTIDLTIKATPFEIGVTGFKETIQVTVEENMALDIDVVNTNLEATTSANAFATVDIINATTDEALSGSFSFYDEANTKLTCFNSSNVEGSTFDINYDGTGFKDLTEKEPQKIRIVYLVNDTTVENEFTINVSPGPTLNCADEFIPLTSEQMEGPFVFSIIFPEPLSESEKESFNISKVEITGYGESGIGTEYIDMNKELGAYTDGGVFWEAYPTMTMSNEWNSESNVFTCNLNPFYEANLFKDSETGEEIPISNWNAAPYFLNNGGDGNQSRVNLKVTYTLNGNKTTINTDAQVTFGL